MKKLMCCIAILIFSLSAFSQNWNEWFRQKRTQIQYLYRQIAALQVYIELGQKGYGIYQDGLTLIGDIKDGDFNLHKDYFASLITLNPNISHSPEINEIINWHEQIIQFTATISKKDLGIEKASVTKLFEGIQSTSKNNVGQMELLITSGNYQLKDDERITQVTKVHKDQQQVYEFARNVYNEVFGLLLQKNTELRDVKTINSFHGLN